MSNTYISVHDPTGKIVLVQSISDYYKLERSRQEMNVGQMVLTLPTYYLPVFLFGKNVRTDTQIRIMRSVGSKAATLDLQTFWFVEEVTDIQDSQGREYVEVRATDSIGLLNRRVVPYEETDAMSDKTGPTGDLMKAFVRENFGALATDTTRDLSAYLTVAPNVADGPTIDVAVKRPTVLSALQEIAGIAAEQGSYVGFDVICNENGTMRFTTFIGQRGNDHRASSANPIYVGRNRGNITDVKVIHSNSEVVNYVYAFGGNIGAVKISEERQDPASVLASPFNRREYVLSDGNEIDLDVLDNVADSYIRFHRPKFSIIGSLQETDSFVYDLNYGYGDYLTVDDKTDSFDARLSAISINDENGETIKAGLAGDSI